MKLNRDPELEKEMDHIIDIICETQQEDGYNYESHITGVAKHDIKGMGERPYSHVVHNHELYNMRHMYEGAIAYYQATGKDKWLRLAKASARHINKIFFEGDPDPLNCGRHKNKIILCQLAE